MRVDSEKSGKHSSLHPTKDLKPQNPFDKQFEAESKKLEMNPVEYQKVHALQNVSKPIQD